MAMMSVDSGGCGASELDKEMDMDLVQDQENDQLQEKQDPHRTTIQALRNFLHRKMSSEESSSERESPQQDQETVNLTKIYDSRGTLTNNVTQKISFAGKGTSQPIQKQRSLDECWNSYVPPMSLNRSTSGLQFPRYLRTDLCVPVLLNRCSFCEQSFELETQLRSHIRNVHHCPDLFFSRQMTGSTDGPSAEEDCAEVDDAGVLDLSIRKHATGSLPNLSCSRSSSAIDLMSKNKSKQHVKCASCNRNFSSKWNWKQHQKVHLKEHLQSFFPY